ncbi:tyrosine-type recombinase/integrase [Methylorubrum aminovorans]
MVERLRGTVLTVECPALRSDPESAISFKLGRTVKASLRTRDEAVATARRVLILERLERLYEATRANSHKLTHRQMVALAGEVYNLLRSRFDEDPGTPEAWGAWKAFVRAARQGRIATAPTIDLAEQADERAEAAQLFGPDLTQGIDALPPSGDRAALDDRCGRLTWWVLSRHGLVVDRETRLRLLEHVADACLDAGWAIKRAAQGDYTPDPKAARFPPFQATPSAPGGITLSALYDRWAAETKPAPSTRSTWRGIIDSLTAHVGHGEASRITPENVIGWKDARLASGRSVKTINDSDLACIRALYRWGIANRLVKENPAVGVQVAAKRKAGTAMLPYQDADVARLLASAERESLPYRRWLPMLAALTGARIGELAALWGTSVIEREGVIGINIAPSPDGATLKNAGSERFVPLHPEIVRAGFLEYAKAKGHAPLFYGKPARRGAEAKHPSKGTSNHLAAWIRDQGFDNERIAPAHGLRHWFKSAASRAGIADSVADTIQGHADDRAAARYRHISITQMAEAVAKLTVPVVPAQARTPIDEAVIDAPMPTVMPAAG